MRDYKKRAIILINESTGEKKECESINAAARAIGVNFLAIQRAALYNGIAKGWRVYEDAETIREHIKELERQLEIVEGL